MPRDELPDWNEERAVRPLAIQLARAALAGPADTASLRLRFERVLGRRRNWLTPLIRQIRLDFGDLLSARNHDELADLIAAFRPLRQACQSFGERPRICAWYPYSPVMDEPLRALHQAQVPDLATPGDLADWLGLNIAELDWFCEARRVDPSASEVLRHYRYRWVDKRRGGQRLIEAPKPRLRAMQRRILDEILSSVPPHPAAHGCVRHRSALSAARPHAGQGLLLHIDLQNFFPTITAGRVHALFRTFGYPHQTAIALTRLVTHSTPAAILQQGDNGCSVSPEDRPTRYRQRAMLRVRHLPQGAPSSPMLANLCAYRLDLRLAGAAAACGLHYTRYVDDLAFSGDGDFVSGWRRFARMAFGIIAEEGYLPHHAKTRAQSSGGAQILLGMVVNRYPNIPRRDYDALKAILHNCVRHGPDSQNRASHRSFRDHLLGRIARVGALNPPRGARLMATFREIVWPADA